MIIDDILEYRIIIWVNAVIYIGRLCTDMHFVTNVIITSILQEDRVAKTSWLLIFEMK